MRTILGTIALEPNRWTGKRNPQFTLCELLPLVKKAGFDKIEIWQWHVSGRYLLDIREARSRAEDLGITFPYIGVYPAFLLEGPEQREEQRIQADILDKAEILGTPSFKIILGGGLKGSTATAEQIALTAERFGQWYGMVRARGITITVELHANTIFDPVECGITFMQRCPELDFSICYQPYGGMDTDSAMALADRFAGRISHMHLQATQPKEQGGKLCLLAEARIDFRKLIPHILRRNPRTSMTLEFVKGSIQDDQPFDIQLALANARLDGMFVDAVLKESGL